MNDQGRQYMGFGLMSLAQILFPSSYIYVSQQNLSMAEFSLFRAIVLMLICLAIARKKQVDLQRSIRTNFYSFLVRNCFVMVHIFALVISHYYLSVAVIHTINSCGPIFVFIWDYFIYNITINRKQILGIAVGITGMLVTVNSDSLYLIIDGDYQSGSTFQNYRSSDFKQILLVALFLVMANIVWAYSASMVKSIKMKDSCQINFHLSIVLLLCAAIYYCLFEVQQKSWEVYVGTVLFSSIPIGIGQVIFTVSLTLTRNTGILTLFLSLSIIVGYSYSLIRYHENINPIAVLGGVLIITGLVAVILLKDNEPSEAVELKRQTK